MNPLNRKWLYGLFFALVTAAAIVVPAAGLMAHGEEDQGPSANIAEESPNDAGFLEAFPTLHPLVVHFPIVLLLTASVLYPGGMFFRNLQLKYAGILLAAAGLGGAILATYWVHPHTAGLTLAAQATLEQHDRFAYLTIYTAAAAVFIQLAGHFTQRRLIEYAGALAMILASIFVGITGHYGAKLTHVHGVGPRGEFLEEHSH
jgi:uncharacterized membrane protein